MIVHQKWSQIAASDLVQLKILNRQTLMATIPQATGRQFICLVTNEADQADLEGEIRKLNAAAVCHVWVKNGSKNLVTKLRGLVGPQIGSVTVTLRLTRAVAA